MTSKPILNRQIFDQAPIGMAISGLDGVLTMVNSSFTKTIGYSEQELIGMSFATFTHPDDLKENLERNAQVAAGNWPSHQMEKRFIHRKGHILHAILKVSTLNNDHDKPEHLLAQVVDITEKVELFNQVQTSEKKFREIFENAAIPMAQSTLSGALFNVNKSFARLMEYSTSELYRMDIDEISHPEDIKENKTKSAALVHKEGKNYSMEKRYLTKSGKTIHALLKVSYIKAVDYDPPHLLGQIVDITSIKQYEQLLEKNNNELTKVNAQLDSFIYRASHDLRGPLATMKGLIHLLKDYENYDYKVMDGMNQSIDKLGNTINKLVAFSGNTQRDIQIKLIDLHKLINESIDSMKYHENYDLASISIHIDPTLNFASDISRIKPIFNNLINNALQYLDSSKDKSTIAINCTMEGDCLRIMITDNGEGMTPETQERAFEMFYRGSERSTGSGLGLYLVNEIVEKLGGEITIQSVPDEGSSFKVILPVTN